MNTTTTNTDAAATSKEQEEVSRQPPRRASAAMSFRIPTNQDATDQVEKSHGQDSWRHRVLVFIHSRPVQTTLMGLLLLDVILLFIELFLLAHFPHCSVIERDGISCCSSLESVAADEPHDRWLAGGHDSICEVGVESEVEAGCDEYKYETVHTVEKAIFGMTVSILSFFFLELNVAMLAMGAADFFRHFFFALDYFIVSVSLILEIFFFAHQDEIYQSLAGFLVVVRIWRFIRISHGIVEITHELAHASHDKKSNKYVQQLEELLQKNGIDLPVQQKNSQRSSRSSGTSDSP